MDKTRGGGGGGVEGGDGKGIGGKLGLRGRGNACFCNAVQCRAVSSWSVLYAIVLFSLDSLHCLLKLQEVKG